jgi:hypothetical protein
MAAQVLNLSVIEQGASWEQAITLDPVVDLTDLTGACQIRSMADANSPVVASPEVTIDVDPETGKFTLSLTAEETANIPCKSTVSHSVTTKYLYDVIFTGVASTHRVLNGTVSVSPRVTRI